MSPINARQLAGVDATSWYDAAAVGRLLGRSARTARGWCRDGKLPSRRDPLDPRRPLVLGRDLLAAAADLLTTSPAPAASETEPEREARGQADLAAIKRLVKAGR